MIYNIVIRYVLLRVTHCRYLYSDVIRIYADIDNLEFLLLLLLKPSGIIIISRRLSSHGSNILSYRDSAIYGRLVPRRILIMYAAKLHLVGL